MPPVTIYKQATTCLRQSLPCFQAVDWFSAIDWIDDIEWYRASDWINDIDWNSAIDWINDIDWLEELRLIVTAALLGGVIIYLIKIGTAVWERRLDLIWLPQRILDLVPDAYKVPIRNTPRFTSPSTPPPPKRAFILPPSWQRTLITTTTITIYGWPSKGGVIIHDAHVSRPDLDFLELDALDAATERFADQDMEDAFCQRLLLLGAIWWSSEAEHRRIRAVEESGRAEKYARLHSQPFLPSRRQRRCVVTAWPEREGGGEGGGVWVAEWDGGGWGDLEGDGCFDEKSEGDRDWDGDEELEVPWDCARLRLASTMDERSRMLRDYFGAKFYEDVRQYKGLAFLNSWEKGMAED